MPDVTTVSPTTTSNTSDTIFQPQPVVAAADDDALRARALDQRAGRGVAIDQQLHFGRSHGSARRARPTTPAGAITAMSALTPSRVPLSIVSVRKSGVAAAPMMSAATVCSCELLAQLEQLLEAARPIGQRALLLHRDLRRRQLALQRVVLDLAPGAARSSRSTPGGCRRRRPTAPRCTSEKMPKVTFSSIGTPDLELTCAEISRICPSITARNR